MVGEFTETVRVQLRSADLADKLAEIEFPSGGILKISGDSAVVIMPKTTPE